MRIIKFTFKNEAKWMMIFSLAIPAMAILVLLVTIVWRRF